MSLFEWSNDYSVGVPSIDTEHRRLVDLLNELHDCMTAGKAAEQLASILEGLVAYTTDHFRHEEELFAQHGFPDAQSHTEEHRRLVEQVLTLQGKLARHEATLTIELLRFLKNWLIKHILGADKAYGPFLVERRVP